MNLLEKILKKSEKIRQSKRYPVRQGKAVMLACQEIDKNLFSSISGTDADCYYNTTNFTRFCEKVSDYMETKQKSVEKNK